VELTRGLHDDVRSHVYRLSWVVGPDGLERLCGKSPREIMLAIGKDTPWLRHTLEGTS
jgi:hypothetical protein